eukprot:6461363-Amphidinium_carterae.1
MDIMLLRSCQGIEDEHWVCVLICGASRMKSFWSVESSALLQRSHASAFLMVAHQHSRPCSQQKRSGLKRS